MSEKVTPSSGNVFEDLGVKEPEEALAKAAIASLIMSLTEGKSQKEVAQILNVDPARISDLAHGRLKGFAIDRLFRYLLALGYDVKVTVIRKTRPVAHIDVSEELTPTGN